MSKLLDTFLRAAATGLMIGVGGVVYLSCDNKYIGAALFGTGLFVILSFGFNLYTGKVGYAVEKDLRYLKDLAVIWLGNLCGTAAAGGLILCTRAKAVGEKAAELCRVKMDDSMLSLFILALFCGMLMFIAADGYKTIDSSLGKHLAIFLPVIVFILCGFEHCVANMFYFTAAKMWSSEAFIRLLVMTAGNSAGGVLIPLLRKGFIISKNSDKADKRAA
ncbi:formate/nitrite transporter family protein [uncultured Ruminococcus sp.]|uniref:formate/nitrite transporter family protein n=1 Tax=uncultured Ruminococcus sp. TaxID=165186 RepID=UPI0025D92A05|nr:formate/nitrite transporter family protein [uncultured Ruminococcus sp.]